MTKDMLETLKSALFMEGIEVIEEVLDIEIPDYWEKDTIDNMMNNVFSEMSEEELLTYYQKYCTSPTLGR